MPSEITFVAMTATSTDTDNQTVDPASMLGWQIIAAALYDVVTTCGVPVETLANEVGFSRQYIYRMIRGKVNPSMDKIEKLMSAAGTPLQTWLSDRAMYGRDKRIHDQIQLILNKKDINAAALKNHIKGTMRLLGEDAES